MHPSPRSEVRILVDRFDAEMRNPDANLDDLAIALSAAMQPGLDVIGALADLDDLAAACPTPTREGVMQYLFGSGMFRGDRSDYYGWQNSCVDRVAARRAGIPITLSVVGIETARRVGVTLVGVGMPGHFIIGDPSDPTWFADPFHGEIGLSRVDCRNLLARMGMTRWADSFLNPTPGRLIIARMLNNLKLASERRDDRPRLAVVMQLRQVMDEFSDDTTDAAQALAVFN